MEEIADAVLGALGAPQSLNTTVTDRPGHDRRYVLNSDKVRDELGWTPTIDFAQGMADTGQLAIAVWTNPDGGPGHIAVLVPSLGEAGTWIAQAGFTNFTRGLLVKGFGNKQPLFYAHP